MSLLLKLLPFTFFLGFAPSAAENGGRARNGGPPRLYGDHAVAERN